MIRLLHDTDTAGDDATALMMALKASNAKVEGVTVTCGNVSFDQEVENALYTIEVAGMSGRVPVYRGARHPLLRDWQTAEEVHGTDGMGNSWFPKARQRPEDAHAVDVMVELVNSEPGGITIVATGPLTNLAMAIRKDAKFAKRVKHLFFMGGTNFFRGNVTPAAEFNMWVDPDSAKVVFHSGIHATMVGWEICLRDAMIGAAEMRKISKIRTREARFFTAINRVAWEFTKRVERMDGAPCPDSITMAIALNSLVATDVRNRFVDVDNESELSRGATYVDELNILGKKPNMRVVYSASKELFGQMLHRMLKGQRV